MKLIYTGDFERLKEFGFIDEQELCNMNYYYSYRGLGSKICIGKLTHKIWTEGTLDRELIKIYDLIKAGLVKKERENEQKRYIYND